MGNREFYDKLVNAPLELWLAVGYLSAICTVVGFAAWYWAIKKWSVSRAGAFIYLVPIGALIVGRIMFGETMNLSVIIGFVIVLAGVFLAGGKDRYFGSYGLTRFRRKLL